MDELVNGLTLMLVGMGTVFIFLTLLVVCITVSSRILNRFWPENSAPAVSASSEDEQLLSVITAAVHQYRKKHTK